MARYIDADALLKCIPIEEYNSRFAVMNAHTVELQKWIPVKEMLPKEKGEYLVTYHPCYWDNIQQDIKVGIDSFRGKTSWAKKKHRRVIAWMPLPEPWKE